MKTFENLYTDYKIITKDYSTAGLAFGKQLINDTHKSVCGLADFTFLDDEWYCSSVASQASYRLPHNYSPNSLISCFVTVGGIKYYPKEIFSTDEFDKIAIDTSTSTSPSYFCIFNDYINFYPLPADTSWTIDLKYRQMAREMSADDYDTGTMTATQNSRTITGIGTTFTVAMEGRYIKLPDGLWYKIQTYSSATELLLAKTYEGATTTSTYIIGECPIIPDGFQEILLYKPLEHFFMMTGEEKRSVFYKNLYDLGVKELKSRYLSRSSNQVFVQGQTEIINPNDYPVNLS